MSFKKILSGAAFSVMSIAILSVAPLTMSAQTAPAAPTIVSLYPLSVVEGGSGLTLTVNGTNFVSGSTVSFNGTQEPTTYVSPTQVTAIISPTDVASAGSYEVTVSNPSGGGTSGSTAFIVTVAPALPNTGFAPNNTIGLNIGALVAAIIASATLLFLGFRFKKVFPSGK